MQSPTPKKFQSVLAIAVFTTFILSIMIGMAYLSFREKTVENILNNFPKDNVVMITCHIFFGNNKTKYRKL